MKGVEYMKYSGAIANLIKKRKSLKVYEFDGMQWIGDGAVLYPVFGMRGLSDKELVHFLDLDPSEIEVQHIKELALDLSANDDFECLITDRGPDVFQGIAWCRTYYTEQGAIFLNSRYFTPVERDKSVDMPVDVYLRTADRDNKKFPYVVLKKGLYIYAVICPIDTWTQPEAFQQYQKLTAQIKLARLNYAYMCPDVLEGVGDEEDDDEDEE